MIIDAIVLAGGRARRLDGTSKPGLIIGGRSLLDRALEAAAFAAPRTTVVVGPVAAPPGVLTTVEVPPFGGPVAGIAAGLALLPAGESWVLLLASDVPRAAEVVPLLLEELARVDERVEGVHLTDRDGRAQWLLGCYRRSALDASVALLGEVRDASVGRLLGGLTLTSVVDVEGIGDDVDTWQDLEQVRAQAGSERTRQRTHLGSGGPQ